MVALHFGLIRDFYRGIVLGVKSVLGEADGLLLQSYHVLVLRGIVL